MAFLEPNLILICKQRTIYRENPLDLVKSLQDICSNLTQQKSDFDIGNFKVTFAFMEKVREVIAYQDHFESFLKNQTEKVQNKIYKVIEAIETLKRVPETYLKPIKTKNGLYEARIQLGSNIWRVFCFFDKGRLVILLNGFQKKS